MNFEARARGETNVHPVALRWLRNMADVYSWTLSQAVPCYSCLSTLEFDPHVQGISQNIVQQQQQGSSTSIDAAIRPAVLSGAEKNAVNDDDIARWLIICTVFGQQNGIHKWLPSKEVSMGPWIGSLNNYYARRGYENTKPGMIFVRISAWIFTSCDADFCC